MEENTLYVEDGAIKISEEVVQTIAAMAVKDVKGVTIAASFADGFVEKFVKKNFNKSVKITLEEKAVTVELHIGIDYGVKIQTVAAELQDVIKRNIETMTDLSVTRVDIYVDGINFNKEPKEPKEVKKAAKAPAEADARLISVFPSAVPPERREPPTHPEADRQSACRRRFRRAANDCANSLPSRKADPVSAPAPCGTA